MITHNVSSWTVHTGSTSKGPSRRPNPHYSNPAEGGKLSRSGLHVRLVKAGEGSSFSPTHVILPLPLNTISHFMVMDVAFFLAIFQFPEVKSISLYGLWLWKVKSVYKLNSTICIKEERASLSELRVSGSSSTEVRIFHKECARGRQIPVLLQSSLHNLRCVAWHIPDK